MRRFQSQWLAWVATAFAIAAFTAPAWAQRPPGQAPKGTRIQGRVIRVQGPDRFVVRTADKKEVILRTNPRTKFLMENRVARFTDLREGVEIDATYDVAEEQNFTNSVTIGAAAAPVPGEAEEDIVEGTVVRVIEPDNQLVIRTVKGKEVIVVTETRTKFTLDNRVARLADFRSGTAVRVKVDRKAGKHIARSVVSVPKRSR